MQLLSSAALMIDEVARSGSIRKASERLNISASAINRQILNFERDAGIELFERLPRGVRPTAAGELLLADIRRWRREQNRAEGQLKDMTGLRRGIVRIGAMECFSTAILPEAIAAFRDDHMLVAIDLQLGGTEELIKKLAANEIDMALCFSPPHRTQLSVAYTAEFPPGIVMAPDHPLAGEETLSLADCASYPFVQPDRSLPLRNLIDNAFSRAGISHPVVTTTNSIAAVKALVAAGDSLAILNELDVHNELARGELLQKPIENNPVASETLSLCTAHGYRPSAMTQSMIDTLKQHLPAHRR